MKAFILILSFFLLTAGLEARVELVTSADAVKQGSLQNGALRFSGDDLTLLGNLRLSNLHIEETLYIVTSSPAVRSESAAYLDVPVSFTFTKVPETSSLRLHDSNLTVSLGGLRVIPVDESGNELILESFSIPGRSRWGYYLAIAVGILALMAIGIWALQRFRRERRAAQELEEARKRISGAREYEEITSVWKDRSRVLRLFPEAESAFRSFEAVYFRSAFKPSQSPEEVKEIIEAYRQFSKSLQEPRRGV